MGEGFGTMQKEIDSFISYLHNVKQSSTNTQMSYQRDLKKFAAFCEDRGIASVSGLKDCLQVVIDEKKNEMENYLPEQFDIVAKSSVQTKDNYVWLVISENADAIIKIIEDGIF